MLFRTASAAASAAAMAMAAAPLAAAELPRFPAPAGVFDADALSAQNHRRWRRDRVDAGDVIGGLLVIGTIAAVASAASRATRGDRYRERDYRAGYRPRTYGSSWQDGRGLGRAVDICAREIERDARIASVDSAHRTGAGWQVSGRLGTGARFTCLIGPDGRIDGVDYGTGGGSAGQWSDDRYAAARAAQDGAGEPLPPYPGGPLGDEGLEPPLNDAPDFPG